MTVEQLMQPRYKVIADYPNSIYKIGEIVQQFGKDFFNTAFFEKYPQLFSKLEWWQDRKPEDMPRYIKDKNGIKVYEVYKHFTCTYPPHRDGEWFDDPNCFLINPGYAQNYSFYLPATQTDYEQYKTLNP